MANLDKEIDWTGCELVERIPGKVSGQPIVRGTRILPEPVLHAIPRAAKNLDVFIKPDAATAKRFTRRSPNSAHRLRA